MSGILGKKLGMTRLLQDDGRVIPITVIQCEPNEIAQVKTTEKDGYPAIVLGFSKLKKPTKTKKFYHVKEFKIAETEAANYKKGDQVTVEALKDVKTVRVTSISKGKGFQGVVRKFHFAGGDAAHGSHAHREPGSIGCRAKPGRVQRGKKMPGRMGGEQVTLRDVPIVLLETAKNLICLKGPVPGPNGSLVIIRKQ
ncbi:MAG: 50S ribosomal protein L3 [Candidatus Gracilibacteria bacterium]|jgi:large subunit ribosomal protein L3